MTSNVQRVGIGDDPRSNQECSFPWYDSALSLVSLCDCYIISKIDIVKWFLKSKSVAFLDDLSD